MNIEEARDAADKLDSQIRGWTASDYNDGINTSGFLRCDGYIVQIDWERVDEFANEVAARAIMEFVNNRTESGEDVGIS